MSDNLKQLQRDVAVAINPTGPPSSILAENHKNVLLQAIAKSGKYTGFPFVAKLESDAGIIPNGTLVFNGNAFNEDSDFTLSLSKFSADMNDIGHYLLLLSTNSIIHFKDFVGRSAIFSFKSYLPDVDDAGNPIYNIVVTGKIDNSNYVYQVAEQEICMIEFFNKSQAGEDFEPADYDLAEFINGEANYYVKKNELDSAISTALQGLPTSAILIKTQKAVITNIGGTMYSVVVPMSNTTNGKSTWQSPSGAIFNRTTNYSYTTDIDLTLNNRIDVIWVDFTGAMGHEVGDMVAVGSPAAYPTYKIPSNAMQYTFITFINGATAPATTLTPEQIQSLINNAKPSVVEFTANANLSSLLENKYLIVNGNVTLTIPTSLLDTFLQCFIFVQTGSLTIALQVGVTAIGYYSLIIYPNERTTITKRSTTTSEYIII